MIKTESKGERTLRSASPHRNAYKADFHTIKCSFDGSKPDIPPKSCANGSSAEPREDIARGRNFGNRVNKIKNIFLQLDSQQQQENQDGKATTKVETPPISSPPKFPVSGAHKTSPTSPTGLEAQSDKTPKGEDPEIDKVALAEKFSVTRKLFERGIKEPTTVERQAPGRVSGRLSQGSMCDERRASRKSVGSSESSNSSSNKIDLSPALAESKDAEDLKQVSRSLNAGPISRRLENFMADSDSEESARTSAKKTEKVCSPTERSGPLSPGRDKTPKPTSPFNDHFQKPTSPSSHSKPVHSPTSPTSNLASKSSSAVSQAPSKPSSPTTKGSDETCVPASRHSSSSADGFNKSCTGTEETKPTTVSPRDQKSSAFIGSFYNRVKAPEVAKRESITLRSSSGDTLPPQSPPSLDPTGAGMVRAELVRVQNESSESEENEEDCVFEELKLTRELSPDPLTGGVTRIPSVPSSQDDLQKVKKQERAVSQSQEGQEEDKRAEPVKQESEKQCEEEEEEEKEEESDQDDQDECGKTSPVFYSFENAAFVDDEETGPAQKEEEEDEEEDDYDDQDYGEYDEISGLSEDEDCSPRRKIRFSNAPIQVSKKVLILNQNKRKPGDA